MTKVVLTVNRDRRSNNSPKAGDRTDANIGSRIKEFHDLLSQKNYYRIPLKFFTNPNLVNLVHNTNTKLLFTLGSNLNKLFESNAKVDNLPANPDAKIIYHDTPYIYYQQIVLMIISKPFKMLVYVLKQLLEQVYLMVKISTKF